MDLVYYNPPYCEEDECGGGTIDLSAYEGETISLIATGENEGLGVLLMAQAGALFAAGTSLALSATDGVASLEGSDSVSVTSPSGEVSIEAGDEINIVQSNAEIRLSVDGLVLNASGSQAIGFFGAEPVTRPAAVAVTAEALHAALVALGLIAGP